VAPIPPTQTQTPETEPPQKWYTVEFITPSNKQAIGNALGPDLETAKENFLKEYPGAKITNMLEKIVPRNEVRRALPQVQATPTPSPQTQAPEFPSSRPLDGEQYPQTRLRILTAHDVRGLSIIQLQYAIDEVYARYGATFPHRPDNQREFEKFSWYHPNPNLGYEAIDQLMSEVERQNIKFLALCRELKRGK
jgi:hypothetical protein